MRTAKLMLAATLIAFAGPAVADKEPPELSEYDRHDLRVTSICAQGHVVVIAHSDVGKGGGLDMMQLQHEVDGRIVPMRCGPEGPLLSRQSEAAELKDKREDTPAR